MVSWAGRHRQGQQRGWWMYVTGVMVSVCDLLVVCWWSCVWCLVPDACCGVFAVPNKRLTCSADWWALVIRHGELGRTSSAERAEWVLIVCRWYFGVCLWFACGLLVVRLWFA